MARKIGFPARLTASSPLSPTAMCERSACFCVLSRSRSSCLLPDLGWRTSSSSKCRRVLCPTKIRDISSWPFKRLQALRLNTPGKSGEQVSAITKNIPEIKGTFSIAGFSFGGATPNAGLVFLPCSPTASARAKSTPRPQLLIVCAAHCSEFRARSSFLPSRLPSRA